MAHPEGVIVAAQHEPAPPADPCLVLGDVAVLLADPDPEGALEVLREGLGLEAAALRDARGALMAGREPKPGHAVLEIPVHGRAAPVGVLAVAGAAPAQLPVLRSAAAVLGLALSGSEDQAVEEERSDLADALHDGPVQSLVVARYAADAAARAGDASVARDAVQAALVELRRFIWQLRPRGSGGFAEAVDQLSGQLTEAGGPSLGLVGDARAVAALRGASAVTAYRVVQAIAQPGSEAVRVTVRLDGGRLQLDVDGGAPLPMPDRWSRRVQAHGGQLTTTTGRVRLVLPHPETRTEP